MTEGRTEGAWAILGDVVDGPRDVLHQAINADPGAPCAGVLRRSRETFRVPAGRTDVAIVDPQGVGVVFNEGLVRDVLGLQGAGPRPVADAREQTLPLAKATVEDPFELWLTPRRRRDGRVVLSKRYIGLFRREDGSEPEMSVLVDRHPDGWGVWNA